MLIGIISYLSDNPTLREKRKKVHSAQLDWIWENISDPHIIVCAQNYNQEDFDSRVEKYIIKDPIGPCRARNVILKELYASDEDYFMMMDDDSFLYPYYDPKSFFQELSNEEFRKLDVIGCMIPEQVPFKKPNYLEPELLTHYIFHRKPIRQLQVLIMNNLRKRYGEEIYFDENMDPKKGTGQEDEDFLIQLIAKGYSVTNCITLIQKSPAYESSTLFETRKERIEIFKNNAKALVDKWKDYGLVLKDTDRPDYRYFYKNYNKTPMRVLIKRKDPLILTDKELPEDWQELDKQKASKAKPKVELKKKNLLGNWHTV